MFLVRLVVGLLKGLILGGLVGYALAAAGMATPGAIVAYPVAAVVGVLVGLVAGKPIWDKDGRIEAGMKAAAGAILAPGLMWLARRFLTFDVPFDVTLLPGLGAVSGTPELGAFAVTSLAAVAGLLAGFYDADNQPQAKSEAAEKAPATKKRVAAAGGDAQEAEAEAAELEAAAAEAARRRAHK